MIWKQIKSSLSFFLPSNDTINMIVKKLQIIGKKMKKAKEKKHISTTKDNNGQIVTKTKDMQQVNK